MPSRLRIARPGATDVEQRGPPPSFARERRRWSLGQAAIALAGGTAALVAVGVTL